MSQAKKQKVISTRKTHDPEEAFVKIDMGTDKKRQEKDLEKKYNDNLPKPDMQMWARAKEVLGQGEAKAIALFKTMYEDKTWSLLPGAEADSLNIKFLGKVRRCLRVLNSHGGCRMGCGRFARTPCTSRRSATARRTSSSSR